jgi:hypothetical protein
MKAKRKNNKKAKYKWKIKKKKRLKLLLQKNIKNFLTTRRMKLLAMSTVLLFGLFKPNASLSESSYKVTIDVIAWDEATGKKVIKWLPQESGYLAWYKAGYEQYFRDYLDAKTLARYGLSSCGREQVSEWYFTPCMIAAMLNSQERSLAEVGVMVDFKSSIQYTDYVGYPDCSRPGSSCAVESAIFQEGKKSEALFDVLLLPNRVGGPEGHTRTKASGKAVSAIVVGKSLAVGSLHLFRHEMAHAMGINGHLNGSSFVFNPRGAVKNCPTVTIPSYEDLASQGKIQKDCIHRTFLGSYITHGAVCTANSMGKQFFFDRSWNVPYYGTIVREVFGCYLANYVVSNDAPTKPAPPPTPAPSAREDPYCSYWRKFVECTHPTLIEKCPITCPR